MPKTCIHPNCAKLAYYNFNSLPRSYCGDHKLPGMINVASARCKYLNCTNGRVYNYIGFTAAYCGKHRFPGMINCSRPKCKHYTCKVNASYGYNNQRDYCYKHKHPMMDKYK